MKKLNFLFYLILLAACSNDDSSPIDSLPAATQIGANTFGCLIDGKLYKPRCEKPSVVFPESALVVWGIPGNDSAIEIEVSDLLSPNYFNMIIHLNDVGDLKEAVYQFDESNGQNSIDGLDNNYINCILYNNKTKQLSQYVSFSSSGSIEISKFTLDDNSTNPNPIISGIFNLKLKNINDNSDILEVTNGRFDINSLTVIYKEFP